MIKDRLLRIIFIPALGLIIPSVAGIISYDKYSWISLSLISIFFILLSYSIWEGCKWVHLHLRPLFTLRRSPFVKLFAICILVTMYGAAVSGLFGLIWFKLSKEIFNWWGYLRLILLSSLSVIVFVLIYEILYLSKEREIDNSVVDQLDRERSFAEMTILRNELDPHFLFNALNTLSYLIKEEQDKAYMFNRQLAEVYKYFLVNKQKDFIALREEIAFIESYFYLLKIRHEEKLNLSILLPLEATEACFIPPGALQILVENAIKHNQFSEREPLRVEISKEDERLVIRNDLRQKNEQPSSTRIGLRNLNARYQFLCQKTIHTEIKDDRFVVSLPIINSQPLNT